MPDMTDEEIIDSLEEIDGEDDIEVDEFEGEFLDSMLKLRRAGKPIVLSHKRRIFALKIIEKYGG